MARKCKRLCAFSSPQGECRKPAEAACPAGLPTNEERIRSMDLDELARIVDVIVDGTPFCVGAERCEKALATGTPIPDAWCAACAKAWLQQVAEEE